MEFVRTWMQLSGIQNLVSQVCPCCEYDLRARSLPTVCPECGSYVAESLNGPRLISLDVRWLQRIAIGFQTIDLARLVIANTVAIVLTLLLVYTIMPELPWPHSPQWVAAIGFAGGLILLTGGLAIASAPSSIHSANQSIAWRGIHLASAPAVGIFWTLSGIVNSTAGGGWLLLIAFIFMIFHLIGLIDLRRRLAALFDGRQQAATRSRRHLFVLSAICILILGISISVRLPSANNAALDQRANVLMFAMTIVWLGFLGTLSRLAPKFRKFVEESKAKSRTRMA